METTDEQVFAEVAAAVGRGERARALDLAVEALDRGLDHPLILVLVAERHEEEGAAEKALALLAQAAEDAPEAAEVWRRSGRLLVRQGRLGEGLAALQKALELEPDVYSALVEAAAAAYRMADLPKAAAYYQRAAEAAPAEAEPVAGLAAIAARRGDFDRARELGHRALERDPTLVTAHMAMGRSEFGGGDPAAAVARTNVLLARPELPREARAGVLDLRADALDALDRPGEAFADYVARNTLLELHHAPRIKAEIGERRIDRARRLARHFSAESAVGRRAAGPDDQRPNGVAGHVFLLGFPRSGTTLLEKALAGHPDIVTLEEIDHLEPAGGYLLNDDRPERRLAQLAPDEIRACRLRYWRGIADGLGGDVGARIVVDKLPLHTANLPLVATLFPEAKLLFALRDPRDVVFSCFRRTFRINAAMYELLTLEGAAAYYDAVMTLAEVCRARYPLRLQEVRHEKVVADFDGEMAGVLAFIGADWSPDVRGFADRARAALRTPSDPQVARGLNADGVGQWRRYAPHLASVLPVLSPWAARFGYAA